MVMYVASVNELFNSVIVNEQNSVKGKQVQHVCMSRGGMGWQRGRQCAVILPHCF
jgi:hypothetical protein